MSSLETPQEIASSQEFLQFEDPVQEAIVGWMLSDYGFFLNCRANIDFTYFTDPNVSDIVRLIYQIHDTYGRHPKKGDVETMFNVVRYAAADAQAKYATLNRCVISKGLRSLDILSKEMTSWKKLILLRRCLPVAGDLYNRKKYSEAEGWMKVELEKIAKASFEKEDKVRFDDGVEFYASRVRDSHRNRCTLGHWMFDELVHVGAKKPQSEHIKNDICSQTYGSLVPGSTTMLVGPSNAGKTTTVATLVFYNLLFRRKILLITLEEKWEDMKHYLNQAISGIQAFDFNAAGKDEELRKKLEGVAKLTHNQLVYIDGVRSGKMFIEDVTALVEIEQEKMKNLRAAERCILREELRKNGKLDSQMEEEFILQDQENRGFDLVIVDYPGKLKSKVSGKNSSQHEEQGYIYNRFVELALIHRFHAVLPVQTNREGYKAANRKDGEGGQVVDQAHVANSFGIAQVASNVITINRSPNDIRNNRIKYYISKTRTAAATGCFVSKSDFARRRAYGIIGLIKVNDKGEEIWTGLNAGQINPGEEITDQAVCHALGDALANEIKTQSILSDMPSGKEQQYHEDHIESGNLPVQSIVEDVYENK